MQTAYAGMHWPNGPEDYDKIMQLPSSLLTMLATEGRFHYDKVRKKGKTVLWRGLPRVGKRPAEIGWGNYRKNAIEACNLWDEQPHYGEEWFVPYNELDLNYERGDTENDFDNIPERLEKISTFLLNVLPEIDKIVDHRPNILFPPFTPDHGDIENVAIWEGAATTYDGLVVHAYGEAKEVKKRLTWYLERFPNHPIIVGEWNSDEPERVLEVLKELESNYSNFKGATYFIWKWYNSPSWWPMGYNVSEREELYNLFLNASPIVEESPITIEPPALIIQWPEEPENWTEDDIILRSNLEADRRGVPRRVLLALLIAESGLRPGAARYAFRNSDSAFVHLTKEAERAIQERDGEKLASILETISNAGSNDISFGLGQQTVRWANEGDHTQSVDNVLRIRSLYFDPEHAITVAGGKVANYWHVYKDDLEALSRYNKPLISSSQNTAAVSTYKRGLDSADELLKKIESSTLTTMISKPTPHIAGTFTGTPKGFLLHGSRSGIARNPKDKEALATSNWALNNPEGLSWHASIGEHEVYIHMEAYQWGWNARSASDDYIAVEFAQATVTEPITSLQVQAFAQYVRNLVLPTYPNIPMVFVTHADVEKSGETGKIDGKTDVFPYGSAEAEGLKQRIWDELPPEASNKYQFQYGFKDKADALGQAVVGVPTENEQYIGTGYSYQMTTKGIMIYSSHGGGVKFLPSL